MPLGLSAPTDVTGTMLLLAGTPPLPSAQGAKAAGNIGRAVASLPAEQTTATPHSPMSRRMSYIVGSKRRSSGVSW